MLRLGVSVRFEVRATVRVKVRSFTFSSFLHAYSVGMHSRRALLFCHRRRMNKFSNFKIHRQARRQDSAAGGPKTRRGAHF